jgi:hemerythrin-like domain-containing protein
MNDPMRILKADHREVEQLLNKLVDTDEGPERESLISEVTMKLTAHMEMEESMIYPLVAERIGQEDEEEGQTEHRLVREGLERLTSMSEIPGFGAAVEMLKGGISHHVEEEENEILPELKDALDKETWNGLGDQIAAAKEAAGLPVPQPPRRKSSKRKASASSGKR